MCQSWLLLSLVLCGAVVTSAAAPLDPDTTASPPSDADAAAASLVSTPYPPLTQMATSEFTVDRNGLWTDTEVPLSDASMRAIREATLASPQDEEDVASTVMHTATADEMETAAAVDENENENEAGVAEDGIDSDIETETSIAPDDVESSESETSATDDEIDIATGPHGRMILIPRSSRLEMAPLVNRLTRIISELKQHSSSLDRITLKLEIEPMLPRKTRHVIPRAPLLRLRRRPHPRPQPRPISLRLVPSRSEIRSRKMLARCRMLLRQAMKKLKRMKLRYTHHQRRMRLAPQRRHRKPRMQRFPRWLRRLGVGRAGAGGVTVLHGNRFKKIDRSSRRISRGNMEVEAERNSTARLFAPSISLRMNGGSMLVVNRGVIVIVNRSANNTLSVTPPAPAPHHRGMFRHFMTPPSHLELQSTVKAAPPARVIEPALNAAEDTSTTVASTLNQN